MHVLGIEELRQRVGFAELQPDLLAAALDVAQVDGDVAGDLHAGFAGVGVGQDAHNGVELVGGPVVEQQVHPGLAPRKAHFRFGPQAHVGQLAQELGRRCHPLLAERLVGKNLEVLGQKALFGFGGAHYFQRVEYHCLPAPQHHAPRNVAVAELNGIEPHRGEREALVFGFAQNPLLQFHPVFGPERRLVEEFLAEAGAGEQAVAQVAVLQEGPAEGLAHVEAHPHGVAGPAHFVGRGGEVGVALQAQHQLPHFAQGREGVGHAGAHLVAAQSGPVGSFGFEHQHPRPAQGPARGGHGGRGGGRHRGRRQAGLVGRVGVQGRGLGLGRPRPRQPGEHQQPQTTQQKPVTHADTQRESRRLISRR